MIRVSLIIFISFSGYCAWAHRLDEYLQATRIAIEPSRLEVEFDLTPGVAVLPKIHLLIDPSGKNEITDALIRDYADRFVSAINLHLDGNSLILRIREFSVPTPGALENGLGTIRLKATANLPELVEGPHRIDFENSHSLDISVYLVNALVPNNPTIRITRQKRDEPQRHYRMDFEVTPILPSKHTNLVEASMAASLLAAVILWKVRQRQVAISA